jgi:hypothetical protein
MAKHSVEERVIVKRLFYLSDDNDEGMLHVGIQNHKVMLQA